MASVCVLVCGLLLQLLGVLVDGGTLKSSKKGGKLEFPVDPFIGTGEETTKVTTEISGFGLRL